jgi:hypothetical protein
LARPPDGLILARLWLAASSIAACGLLIALVAQVVAPGHAVQDSTIGFAVLVGIIWVQTLWHFVVRRRQVLGSRHAYGPLAPQVDVLATDVMVRIADIEVAMTRALDALDAAGPGVVPVSDDDLAVARRIAVRGPAALRDLRGQMVALGRVVTTALSPDQQRLTAAGHTVRLRLQRGLRDCEEFASVAATPQSHDFRRRFADAAERVSILVADVNP